MLQEALLPLLVAQTGNWSWVDSARQGSMAHKWGWESNTPGVPPRPSSPLPAAHYMPPKGTARGPFGRRIDTHFARAVRCH